MFASHLALLLDGLFPHLSLLLALLLITRLRGDTGQVRVVDPGHSLRLLGGQTSRGKNVQWDTRPGRHTDRLRLKEKGIESNCSKARIIVIQFQPNFAPFLVLQ